MATRSLGHFYRDEIREGIYSPILLSLPLRETSFYSVASLIDSVAATSSSEVLSTGPVGAALAALGSESPGGLPVPRSFLT